MELQLRTREREGYPEDLPAFFEMLASGRNPFVPGKVMVFGWRDDRTVTLELRSTVDDEESAFAHLTTDEAKALAFELLEKINQRPTTKA